MGAGQSSDGARGGSSILNQEVKTSYYELLGVDRHAGDDEIKKAYRRKALELHPDRNYGDVERTTALFASVQSAYEILSDPQERAWYDSHEDAILRDEDPASNTADAGVSGAGGRQYEHKMGMTSADDITRLFRKFNANIEFSDAPSGFFGFLRDTFAQIVREEEIAAQREGSMAQDYPSFGHKEDTHEDVAKPFYASWSGFSTTKSFAWRDRYRTADAEDRRMRRLMEKENKRFRSEGIAEFNDAVRSLVAFVRKRDPRYKPNTQTEAERQKVLRDLAAAHAARQRRANEEKMNDSQVPEWATRRDGEQAEEDRCARPRNADEVAEEMEEESEEEHYECVACRKTFKSEKQFEAHEKSKKHVKAVAALRRQLQKEGQSLDLDGEANSNHEVEKPTTNDDLDVTNNDRQSSREDHEDGSRRRNKSSEPSEKASEVEDPQSDTEDDNSDLSLSSIDTVADRTSTLHLDSSTNSSTPPSLSEPSQPGPKPIGKAAQKRAKKAAASADSTSISTGSTAEAAVGGDFKCAVCKAGFPSKTRMFQHVRDFGHAAPAGTVGGVGKKKGGKKGKG